MEQFDVIVFLHYEGVLSVSHLISIYIYGMLTRLCVSGFGCMIGHKYCGAVGNADDISLIAPSIYELNV